MLKRLIAFDARVSNNGKVVAAVVAAVCVACVVVIVSLFSMNNDSKAVSRSSTDVLSEDLTIVNDNQVQDPDETVLGYRFTREFQVDAYMNRLHSSLNNAQTPVERHDAFWGTTCDIWSENGEPLPFDGNVFWDYLTFKEAGIVLLGLIDEGKMPYDLAGYLQNEMDRAFGENPQPRCPN